MYTCICNYGYLKSVITTIYVCSIYQLIWYIIAPKSFLFGTAQFSLCTRWHSYIVTNSINSLLIGSRCIPNGTHTNHCWSNLAHASKHRKLSLEWMFGEPRPSQVYECSVIMFSFFDPNQWILCDVIFVCSGSCLINGSRLH